MAAFSGCIFPVFRLVSILLGIDVKKFKTLQPEGLTRLENEIKLKELKMTKKTMLVLTIIALLVTLSFSQVLPPRRYANRGNRLHTFDVTVPVEVSGVITQVKNCNLGRGWYANGISLTVDDGNQQSLVHMGPIAYLNSYNWQFKQGEEIQLKAFKGTGNYTGELFAAEVIRNGKQLVLRDRYGFPMWRQSLKRGRGMGRRGRGFWR